MLSKKRYLRIEIRAAIDIHVLIFAVLFVRPSDGKPLEINFDTYLEDTSSLGSLSELFWFPLLLLITVCAWFLKNVYTRQKGGRHKQ